jgi:type I restriction enzyme S subunit
VRENKENIMRRVTLGQISEHITSGSRGWAKYYSDTGALFLRMTNLPKIGIKLLLNDNKYVSLPHSTAEGTRTRVQPKDILVSITAELGKIGLVEQCLGEAYINQHVALVRVSDQQVDPRYLAYYLSTAEQRHRLNRLNDAGAKAGLNLRTISNFSILLPTLSGQIAIADLLSTWDAAIEKTEQLIEKKETVYSAELSKHLYTNRLKRVKLRKFLQEVSIRNRDQRIKQVLSVTNTRGFARPEEQFDRQVASSNLSNYKIVTHGEYAYNPSRINVGSIARLDNWNVGVLSPMYTVFKIKEQSSLNTDLFMHWLNSHEAKQRIKLSTQGSVRETVSFSDFCAIGFPQINQGEQGKLAKHFNCLVREINLLKQLLFKYQTQKRGLMQKLLTGEWRVHNNSSERSLR